jgi:hypothetical protein
LNAVLILIIPIALMVGCKQGGKSVPAEGSDSISLGEIKPLVHTFDTLGGLPIFYNMYLSVEMSTLFQASGAVFKPELLNSADKMSDYVTSSKKALNLGVYAVDLSYSKVFEQYETAARYFNAMQKMSEELGIPGNYFENTAKRFDRNINNKDSLISIANEVYMATDKYLRENERYSSAAQIILGGWIEAVQIAVDIASTTKENLQKLQQLQVLFNSFVVKVDSKFNPDTPEGKKAIQDYLIKVNEIGRQIKAIRKEIVS